MLPGDNQDILGTVCNIKCSRVFGKKTVNIILKRSDKAVIWLCTEHNVST